MKKLKFELLGQKLRIRNIKPGNFGPDSDYISLLTGIIPMKALKPYNTTPRKVKANLLWWSLCQAGLLVLFGVVYKTCIALEPRQPPAQQKVTITLTPTDTAAVLGANEQTPVKSNWHPSHKVKLWRTWYKGRTFLVAQLPRCEHMECVIAYNPSGETPEEAKKRLGGAAVCTGSFHHPRTMALADFLQREGSVISAATTGRSFVSIKEDGIDISRDYASVKGKPGISALALGQQLIPLQRDGFSNKFMNELTGRMAIGLNNNYIFIVRGKSDIWKLASFMKNALPCDTAVNSDGGHVLYGKAPVHLVFRWKNNTFNQ